MYYGYDIGKNRKASCTFRECHRIYNTIRTLMIQQEFSFLGCAGAVWLVYLFANCLPNKLEYVGISIKMSGRNPDHTIQSHYYFVFVAHKEHSQKTSDDPILPRSSIMMTARSSALATAVATAAATAVAVVLLSRSLLAIKKRTTPTAAAAAAAASPTTVERDAAEDDVVRGGSGREEEEEEGGGRQHPPPHHPPPLRRARARRRTTTARS